MEHESNLRSFKVIRGSQRLAVSVDQLRGPASQKSLFPVTDANLLVFAFFPEITEEEFTTTLSHSKPTFVLELRRSPRFDVGSLSRRLAFQKFAENHCKYVDLSAETKSIESTDDLLEMIRGFLKRSDNKVRGPVMMLVNDTESASDVTARITEVFSSVSGASWQTYEVPRFS